MWSWQVPFHCSNLVAALESDFIIVSHSGSALHRHLLESGLGDVELSSPASSDRSVYNAVITILSRTHNQCLFQPQTRSLASELAALEERDHTPAELLVP